MKLLVAMILGLAGGAMATWLVVQRPGEPESSGTGNANARAAAEYEKLKVKFETQEEKVEELSGELAELKKEREVWLAQGEAAENEVKDDEPFGKAMSTWGRLQAESEQRELEKLLGLNSVQSDAFGEVMATLQEERKKAYGNMFSGKGSFRDFAIADGAMPQVEAFAKEFLNEEQAKAYEEYRAKREKDRVERNANEELMHLQTMMTLSDDQKDAAFNLFADFAAKETPESYIDLEPGNEAELLTEGFLNPRLEAMKSVLSPEQQATYVEQAKIMMDMMIQMTGGESEGGEASE